jgi:hypothetical protein
MENETEFRASSIQQANEYERQRKQWDSAITMERWTLFLAGAVVGVLCAVAITVLR